MRGRHGPKGRALTTAPALRPAREPLQPRPFFLCLSVLSPFLLCRPRASCRPQAGLGQLSALWQSGCPVPVPTAGLSPSPQGLAHLSAGPGPPLSTTCKPQHQHGRRQPQHYSSQHAPGRSSCCQALLGHRPLAIGQREQEKGRSRRGEELTCGLGLCWGWSMSRLLLPHLSAQPNICLCP